MLAVNLVMVVVLKKVRVLKHVQHVMVMAKCKCARDYSRFSKHVQRVLAKVKLFQTLVLHVVVKGV